MTHAPFQIAIIGAGPAGLMTASRLSQAAGFSAQITFYDHMPSAARKFLLAGRGGLNLTHATPLPGYLNAYGEAAPRLESALAAFSPADVRGWVDDLGEATFVGSSGRVFPKSFKASPLLRAWLRKLESSGVRFQARHRWLGWDNSGALMFETADGLVNARPDATILALGGASWAKLGSDGRWVDILRAHGIGIAALEPSNCGFDVHWSEHFSARHAGEPLKSAQFTCDNQSLRGEAIVTAYGLEGGAIYALSGAFRQAIKRDGFAPLELDLRPDVSLEALKMRLEVPRKGQSDSSFLRKAGLMPAHIGLLREVLGKNLPRDAALLAASVKRLRLRIEAPRPIDRAISTAGGVQFAELNEHLMLTKIPGTFVCGEMLDFDAPTGGYLLQAAFSTGILVAEGVIERLKMRLSGAASAQA